MCKSKKSKEPFIDIELIVSPRYRDSVTKREYQAEIENELKSVKGAYFIFLGDEDTLTISKDFHERTIVIGKDKESEYILTQILGSKERIGDCLYDDLFKALSIHLERFALTGMRSACENLYSVLTDNDVAGNKYISINLVKRDGLQGNIYVSRSLYLHICYVCWVVFNLNCKFGFTGFLVTFEE